MKSRHLAAVLLVASLLHPFHAQARLGETEAQCEERYGKPTSPHLDTSSPVLQGATNRTYKYQGWLIRAAFVDGKAVMLRYSRQPGQKGGPNILDEEAQAILEGERNGGQWQESLSISPFASIARKKAWLNTNGSSAHLTAISGSTLVVESPAAEAFRKTRNEEQERQRKAAIPKF